MNEKKQCPLWYDDGCPYLMVDGKCELDNPAADCDDYAAYAEDE